MQPETRTQAGQPVSAIFTFDFLCVKDLFQPEKWAK